MARGGRARSVHPRFNGGRRTLFFDKTSTKGAIEFLRVRSERKFDLEVLEERFFAALAYLAFLCFVPLLLKKESRFAEFHGKQGLVLFIFEIAAGVLSAIPALGDTLSTPAFVVLSILSMVGVAKALVGESWQIPVIQNLASKMSL